jgi:ketosteroid isomerase-like protein
METIVTETDSAKQNVKIVEIMLANGHAQRWDVVRPYVADDLVLHVPEGLPFGGDYHGWEGYINILKTIGAFFSELKGGSREIATVGNKVIVMNTLTGRIAKNGQPISFPLTDIWELRDGKVVEITAFYYDTKAISAAADMP